MVEGESGGGEGGGGHGKGQPICHEQAMTAWNATDLDVLVLEVEGVLPNVDTDDRGQGWQTG